MRIRTLAVAAAAAALPFSLAACGGASVEDFCERYLATSEIEPEDGEQAQELLEEMADSVPDDAEDVEEAVRYMAENFPADVALEDAVAEEEMSEEELEQFFAAADTVSAYGEENCA
jgi:transcriptional regulator GlxA family with amidase domain